MHSAGGAVCKAWNSLLQKVPKRWAGTFLEQWAWVDGSIQQFPDCTLWRVLLLCGCVLSPPVSVNLVCLLTALLVHRCFWCFWPELHLKLSTLSNLRYKHKQLVQYVWTPWHVTYHPLLDSSYESETPNINLTFQITYRDIVYFVIWTLHPVISQGKPFQY